MTKRGMLIVFSGPSGVGKDTVLHRFLEREPGCELSVSATTRPPRPGERDGVDYHYITRERFEGMIAAGEMLEWAEYSGNLYGTPLAPVEERLDGGINVILEIEVQGAEKIRRDRRDAMFIFVMPPSWECLRARLENRGTETAEMLERRLRAAHDEIQGAARYDYVIVNDDIDRCVDCLRSVITAAEHSARYMKDFIGEVLSHA